MEAAGGVLVAEVVGGKQHPPLCVLVVLLLPMEVNSSISRDVVPSLKNLLGSDAPCY